MDRSTDNEKDAQPELDLDATVEEEDGIEQIERPLEGEAGPLKDMVDTNFLEYASYVICERAIPNIDDGFKPVQRRIMHALHDMDDGRFIKVANVVGHTMQYHPHGDASIADALVNLTTKGFLIEGQGNFGNIFTGDRAAAPRYIECRLTGLARDEVFNTSLTTFIPSYDGRNQEPVTLPSKLPLLLMLGAEGIAVGLATRILPHNFIELLQAQIAVIEKKRFRLLPDFPQGGIMDGSGYDNGRGSVRVRAVIEEGKEGTLVIRELPYGCTTESLIATIEDAARRKKVPVKSINDFTSDKVEIELCLAADADPARAKEALYAFTACESSLASNIVVICHKRPVQMTVTEVVKKNTEHLLKVLKKELLYRKDQLLDEFHARTLTRIFIEERIYKKIEQCKTQDTIYKAVEDGVRPFRKELRRDVTRKDIDMLLAIRIRRISLFDINKNKKDIEVILTDLVRTEKNLKDLNRYAIRTIRALIKKYGNQHPRRTRCTAFEAVEIRELTASELEIRYNRKTGYLGTKVDGSSILQCSSYDKVVLFWRSGKYVMMPPPEKTFVDKDLLLCLKFDRDRVMTTVYTSMGFTYIKRFTLGGTIMNFDYLFTLKDSRVLVLEEGTPGEVFVKYSQSKGQRIHQQVFKPGELPVKGVKARGNQMTTKKIEKISLKTPRWWEGKSPRGAFL
jgi:topoisomerase-4 subunit A